MDSLGWMNFQTKWEFNHLRWMFGVDSVVDVFRKMQTFTLARPDHTQFLHQVKCPVMVTGAAASIYAKPEVSTTRIYITPCRICLLDQKLQWIATDAAKGGLQV